MSTEILRRAAVEIREDYSAEAMDMANPDPFMYAVADLMEMDADCAVPDDYDESTDLGRQYLLRVARAYLGESQ